MSHLIRCRLIDWFLIAAMCLVVSGCEDRAETNQRLRRESFYGHLEDAWKYLRVDVGLEDNATISDLRKALADLNAGEAANLETLAPDELLLATLVGIQRSGGMEQLTLSERRLGESRLPLLDYSQEIQREFVRDPDKDGFPSFYLSESGGRVTLTSDLQVVVD